MAQAKCPDCGEPLIGSLIDGSQYCADQRVCGFVRPAQASADRAWPECRTISEALEAMRPWTGAKTGYERHRPA